MRHARISGLCIVAVLAVLAVMAVNAYAEEPAMWQCGAAAKEGKRYLGHYTSRTCPPSSYVPTGGKYELEEWNVGSSEEKTGKRGKVKEFKGKSGTVLFDISDFGPFACKHGSDTGQFTGPKTVGDVNMTFAGCELNKIKCGNTATAGEIKTKTLKGEIGYVSEVFGKPVEHTTVGLDLMPESGAYVAEEIRCEILWLRIGGSVIGEVLPPYNVFTKELKLRFQESAGKQAIQSFEGMPKDTLLTETWGGFEWNPGVETGLSGEVVNKGEELELKA